MKKLRKMLAVLLCVIMTLSVTNVSFAQEETADTQNNVIILNAGKGTFGAEEDPDTRTIFLGEDRVLTATQEPIREGWTFKGWYIKEIEENFWGDEQGETVSALVQKCREANIENPDEAARKKDFTWIIVTKDDQKLLKDEELLHNGDRVPDNATKLYAVYEPTTVTVKWHYHDDWVASDGETQTGILTDTHKQYGSKLVRAEATGVFAWEGRELEGCYYKDESNELKEWDEFKTAITDTDRNNKVYYVSQKTVTGDLDLYAKWTTVEPDSLRLTSKNGSGLAEPGTEVTISATYSPISADAPKLNWEVDDSDLAEIKSSDNGLICTVSIKADANVKDSNKIVTVTATSQTEGSDLKAEISITVGHNWKFKNSKDASCGAAGQTVYQCAMHPEVTKVVASDVANHRYGGGNITKEPTCVEKGERTYTCIVCGDKKTEEVPATGVHTWDGGKVTTAPTCVKTGVKTYTCTVCQEKKKEVISATGKHTWKDGICTVCGAGDSSYEPTVSVSYRTHVQSIGWQSYMSDGQMAGTTGQKKRLEGINIKVEGNPNLGIQYTTHVQSYGWLPWSSNDDMSGTEGEAKRLEAIKIQLTGADKDNYDVYYRVHAESYGWLDWTKNGEPAGTSGYGKRLEGIQILVVKKDEKINEKQGGITSTNSKAYIAISSDEKTAVLNKAATPNVSYRTHVQSYGWQAWKYNGAMAGTSGKAKRLEGINIKLTNMPYSGGITYRTHVQKNGWMPWVSNGTMSGTEGEAKRLEAIEIKLTGEMAEYYDVYYRVHAQSYGWLAWTKNGETAGTSGVSKRLEGIQIVLVPKGSAAPSNNYGGVTSTNSKAYIH